MKEQNRVLVDQNIELKSLWGLPEACQLMFEYKFASSALFGRPHQSCTDKRVLEPCAKSKATGSSHGLRPHGVPG